MCLRYSKASLKTCILLVVSFALTVSIRAEQHRKNIKSLSKSGKTESVSDRLDELLDGTIGFMRRDLAVVKKL